MNLEDGASEEAKKSGLSNRMVFKLSLAASKLIDHLCKNMCSMLAIINLLRDLPGFLHVSQLFVPNTGDQCWRIQMLESLVSLRDNLDNSVRRVNVCPFDDITLYLVALFAERQDTAFERECDSVCLRHDANGDFDYNRVRTDFRVIVNETMESWMQKLMAGVVHELSYLHPKQWFTQLPGAALEATVRANLRQGLLPPLYNFL